MDVCTVRLGGEMSERGRKNARETRTKVRKKEI